MSRRNDLMAVLRCAQTARGWGWVRAVTVWLNVDGLEICAGVILLRSCDSNRDSSGRFLVPVKIHPRRGHEGPAGE